MKIKSINPTTEKVMREFNLLNFKESINQLEKSRVVFLNWKKINISERVKYIKRVSNNLKKEKNKLAKLITNEMGKPITQSIAEIDKCVWLCDYYAKNAKKFLKDEIVKTESYKSYVTFEPLGIVLGIMPWNFPFWQVFRFAIPALCAGNVCVLKHSSNVPQCALAIENILIRAGLKNVFKTLLIDSKTALSLIDENIVDAVSLTGSTEAGSKIAEVAGRNIKKIVLELGGNDPFIVLKDAHIDSCCKAAVQARMLNAGQSCIAAKRFIVVKDVAEEFENGFVEHVKSLNIGNPLDEKIDIGPLAREDLVLALEKQIKNTIKKGGKILYGGFRPKTKGYFYMPTVITSIKENMAVFKEETFGPVASIMIVKDEKEAIEKANKTKYGLGASIWSKNIKKAEKLAGEIEAGMVFINKPVRSDPRLPFGGIKKSGFGRELSRYGLKEFINIKSIVIKK